MYKDLAKEIFKKLVEEDFISKDIKQEAINAITYALCKNLSNFEDVYLCGADDLHDTLSSVNRIKYHGEDIIVDNWYCRGRKFILENNDKEYIIYNDLELYVVEELEENYIEIFDVVKH